MQSIINEYLPPFYRKYGKYKRVSESIILEHVKSNNFFGALEVDIEVPSDKYEYFSEFSPIFCTTVIPFHVIGEHMQQFCKERHLKQTDHKLLVGGMSARKILLASPLLQWYLQQGLVVTKVYQVIEFCPMIVFDKFIADMVESRRKADDPNNPQPLLGEISKILMNSGYGSMLLRKENHTKITYVEGEHAASIQVNNKRFKNITALSDDIYEIESYFKTVNMNIAVTIGWMILNYAKLFILKFVYECIMVIFDQSDFELIYCDTDSIFLSFSTTNWMDCIKPEFRDVIHNQVYNSCSDEIIVTPDEGFWFTRKCCQKHILFDQRTIGLMKLEVCHATKMIALSSKTYIVKGDGFQKVSAKGVQKKFLEDVMTKFENVLSTGDTIECENRGIKYDRRLDQLYTYIQKKNAFSYLYFKREVQDDGISTKPLKMTLSPWVLCNTIWFESELDVLSPYYDCVLIKHGHEFFTAEHLFHYEKSLFFKSKKVAEDILEEGDCFNVANLTKDFVVNQAWIKARDKIMQNILLLKLSSCKALQLYFSKLKQSKEKYKFVFSSHRCPYWSCGLRKRMAELTPEDCYPDHNKLGKMWTKLLYG